jgi:pyruvate, water dikinase
MIGVHPKALLDYRCPARRPAADIRPRIAGYADPVSFYVDKLAEGISTLAPPSIPSR